MSIQDLYLLHDKGYSIYLDGDNKTFIMQHANNRIKGFLAQKNRAEAPNKKTLF